MTVALTVAYALGTSNTVGVTIANNATSTGSQIDLLGGTTSEVDILYAYLYYTSTAAAGLINVSLFNGQVSGATAQAQAALIASIVPVIATQAIFLGTFTADRYIVVSVANAAVTASLTNVSVGISTYVVS